MLRKIINHVRPPFQGDFEEENRVTDIMRYYGGSGGSRSCRAEYIRRTTPCIAKHAKEFRPTWWEKDATKEITGSIAEYIVDAGQFGIKLILSVLSTKCR